MTTTIFNSGSPTPTRGVTSTRKGFRDYRTPLPLRFQPWGKDHLERGRGFKSKREKERPRRRLLLRRVSPPQPDGKETTRDTYVVTRRSSLRRSSSTFTKSRRPKSGSGTDGPIVSYTNVLRQHKLLHRHMKCSYLTSTDRGLVVREMSLHYDLLIPLDRSDPLPKTETRTPALHADTIEVSFNQGNV